MFDSRCRVALSESDLRREFSYLAEYLDVVAPDVWISIQDFVPCIYMLQDRLRRAEVLVDVLGLHYCL